ncbi:MAG: hypothetical protein LBI30_00720 [Holosporales bacterium]|jgi:hypothetical protein|nr:hypothetical protein [Holosporales bacterium]
MNKKLLTSLAVVAGIVCADNSLANGRSVGSKIGSWFHKMGHKIKAAEKKVGRAFKKLGHEAKVDVDKALGGMQHAMEKTHEATARAAHKVEGAFKKAGQETKSFFKGIGEGAKGR